MNKYLLSIFRSKLGIEDTDILKSYFKLSVGLVIASVISLITINFTNRFLSPQELGVFSYNRSLFELAFGILSLNIYSSYLRFNLKGDNINLRYFVRKITLISTFAFVVFIYYLTKSYISLLYAFIIVYNERIYYYRSLIKINQINFIQILAALVTLLSISLNHFFSQTSLNSNTIFLCYGLGFFSVFFIRKPELSTIDKEIIPIKNILLVCVPTIGLVLVDWILNLSSNLFIKEMFDYKELANYAIAQRGLIFLKFITGTFLMFYPMIYFRAIEDKQKEKINKSRNIILLLLLFILIALFLGAKFIYLLLGAKDYLTTSSITIFRILLFAELIRVSSSFYGLYLTYSLQTIKNLFILSAGSILNVLLQFLFLKKYGILFSAISTFISSLLILILIIIFSYKNERNFLNEKIRIK